MFLNVEQWLVFYSFSNNKWNRRKLFAISWLYRKKNVAVEWKLGVECGTLVLSGEPWCWVGNLGVEWGTLVFSWKLWCLVGNFSVERQTWSGINHLKKSILLKVILDERVTLSFEANTQNLCWCSMLLKFVSFAGKKLACLLKQRNCHCFYNTFVFSFLVFYILTPEASCLQVFLFFERF